MAGAPMSSAKYHKLETSLSWMQYAPANKSKKAPANAEITDSLFGSSACASSCGL